MKIQTKDVTEEMPRMHMSGFIVTISPISLVLLIKLMGMIMELDAVLKLSVKIVFQEKDVGLNKRLKFMGSKNSVKSKVKKI